MDSVVRNKETGEFEPTIGTQYMYKLRALKDIPGITEEQKQTLERAAQFINAQEVINYQMVNSCKKAGFVYDKTQREGEEFQAFMWLQDKGAECMASRLADSKHLLVKGVEERLEDLINFYLENKNAS